MIPALRSRNYRLYFVGQGISLVGTWMTQLATIWLVFQLTHSPVWLGVVSLVSQLPNLLLAPFGGVLADRWNLHRTLLVTQALAMLQSLALAALTLPGPIQLWQLLLLAALQGLINAVDAPTRQALVPAIAEQRQNLTSAIALNSSMVTLAKLLGPAPGGFVIASVGAGFCFLIDGLSYIAVLASLLAMRLAPATRPPRPAPLSPRLVQEQLLDGVRYTVRSVPIPTVMVLLAVVSFLGLSPNVVLPIYTDRTFGGDAHILGLLMAAPGLGALLAALTLTRREGLRGVGRLLTLGPLLLGGSMVLFSQSGNLPLSLLLLVLTGVGTLLQTACSNTVIQTLVDDDKRGRVMRFYLVAFIGMTSLGNLFSGALVSLIGLPAELFLSGMACMAVAVVFARLLPGLRRQVRSQATA